MSDPRTHHLTRDLAQTGFSTEHEPVLTVVAGSGDRVSFDTDDAAYAEMERVGDLTQLTSPLNPITGPVRVEGAEPGDLLAVTVHDIALAEFGWSVYLPGAGALSPVMGEQMLVRRVPVDAAGVHLGRDLVVPAAPMVGCLGVAPASGSASTVMPSYPTGGNMDLTDVGPGTTVYLPVQVDGALFSLGDVHAVMSRGESSFVAIETAGTVTVSLDVVKGGAGTPTHLPWLETEDEVVFVGLGDPVQDSVQAAYEALFAHLTGHGWDPMDAYVAMSALAHTELGGPTGSADPDPLHPLRPVGAVTIARFPRDLVQR